VAFVEINQDTPMGDVILNKLYKLNLI